MSGFSIMRQFSSRQLFFVIMCLVLVTGMISQTLTLSRVNAWGCDEASQAARAEFYAQNNIPTFYDPCESAAGGGACTLGSGSLDGPAPTQLQGADNAEKVWNYFIGRGLTPVAAAGAMGNIEVESGFNPWIGESGNTSINPSDLGVGFGLIQWTNTDGDSSGRRYGVIKAIEAAGINLSSVDQNDEKQTDTALLIELNWLWDGEYKEMTWQEGINKETSVSGDTSVSSVSPDANAGNGSTLYFHAAVERSGDSASMLQTRINNAEAWLDKFGGGGPENECSDSGATSDVIEVAKKAQDGATGLQPVENLQGGLKGIGCQDCVTFVASVFVGAGYPKPLAPIIDGDTGITSVPGGSGGLLDGYWSYALGYDSTNYKIISNAEKQPGDILVWRGHVGIFAGGQNVYEGNVSGGHCNIGGISSNDVEDTLYVLRYSGEKK